MEEAKKGDSEEECEEEYDDDEKNDLLQYCISNRLYKRIRALEKNYKKINSVYILVSKLIFLFNKENFYKY